MFAYTEALTRNTLVKFCLSVGQVLLWRLTLCIYVWNYLFTVLLYVTLWDYFEVPAGKRVICTWAVLGKYSASQFFTTLSYLLYVYCTYFHYFISSQTDGKYKRWYAFYGAEIWTLRTTDQKYLESFEMWCWRRMEEISWTDRVRNEEV